MDYLLHILVLAAIFSLLAISQNLLTGYLGLISLCQAAVFGVGAYTAALCSIHITSQAPVVFAIAITFGVFIGLLGGTPALRLRRETFLVATLCIQVALWSVFNNLDGITGGPMGVSGIPPLRLWSWRFDTVMEHALIALACLAAFLFVCNRLAKSALGRVLRSVREDEISVRVIGKDTASHKIHIFGIASAMSAAAGVIYASYATYIDPNSFSVDQSILLISMVIIGGAGRPAGPLLGAAILVVIPEVFRFVGFPSSVAANLSLTLYGLALIACMLWQPQGLMGEYVFERAAKLK